MIYSKEIYISEHTYQKLEKLFSDKSEKIYEFVDKTLSNELDEIIYENLLEDMIQQCS